MIGQTSSPAPPLTTARLAAPKPKPTEGGFFIGNASPHPRMWTNPSPSWQE